MIETLPEVASTNAELLGRLSRGEHVGEECWLIADRQHAGRGRAGRVWHDGAGNLMGSTAVHLRATDPAPQTLALVAGVAAAEAVSGVLGAAAVPMLKWPNDLLIAGAKLGGILLERQGLAVVVGVGINLASAPQVPGRATTCLAEHGCSVTRDDLAAALATSWSAALERWHGGEWPALREAWLIHAHPPGTMLGTEAAGGRALVGAFTGLGEDGAVHLRLADGTAHVIHAGDIEMVGGHAAGD